ncbi:MAG: hypothetical protein K8U03_11325 [Planctomycetia bacterium]|nr:hypothetical protein [Planctomycetia bacterium]
MLTTLPGLRTSRRGMLVRAIGIGLAVVGLSTTTSAADAPTVVARPNITGCWTCGSWVSCCTGHKGTLRATITCCGNNYECQFSGTFMKVIPFRYTVTLQTTSVGNGIVYFRASKQIPLFGGSFNCSGWATASKFHANYTSPKDRGTFDMSR